MTTELRELLTLAARAMGRELKWRKDRDDPHLPDIPYLSSQEWRPDLYPNDSHDMCAALGIDTIWHDDSVDCMHSTSFHDASERFKDHNDRSAAWRLAALRVAAEIGKGMRG